ncbi:MAG: endopeptidase La [Roseiflexaceae bacterium]
MSDQTELTFSDEANQSNEARPPQSLPLMVLDGVVVFPYTVVTLPLDEASLRAAEAAMQAERLVLLVAEREDSDEEDPLPLRLHAVGVVARIEQMGKLPSGNTGIVVRGLVRAVIGEQEAGDYLRFRYTEQPDAFEMTPSLESLMAEVHAAIDSVLDLRPGVPQEIRNFVRSISDPGHLADNTGYSPDYTFAERQDLLETIDVVARLVKVRDFYRKQLNLMQIQARLRQEVEESTSKQQREFYLRQQMRAIQKELGEDDPEANELEDLRQKLAALDLTEVVRKEADRELNRLGRMNNASPEYQMVRTYLEWLVELPWNKTTGKPIDVAYAREVLDADHYGLEKIKERILEYLAVRQRRTLIGEEGERSREPILAFVGPPGVGKTSLGQSIARALGRQFVRMALGGVRDEAELRGFRRTYIGSQPGRLIQELRRAGAADPVILLDEIDKLSSDYRGDPAAALLEVLDPEQNHTFTDHYLNLPFDLSKVLFIATANTFDTVPPALRDRLEVIELSGYTAEEKVQIAESHLVPRQLRANGLRADEVQVQQEALRSVIAGYTRESGVRTLERQIGSVLRKATRRIAEQGENLNLPVVVDAAFVRDALGRPRFFNENRERIDQTGIATGLVWTPVGGDIVFVEAAVVSGGKELKLTGQLGDVMRESAEAALTYVRSRALNLGIDPKFFDSHAIHIHVPGGAVPKDGPSAGITMATALASAATGRLVRDDIAMTGEITLRGKVLPIGGVKEKALGAHRAGIKTILLPKRNEADLEDLPAEVAKDLEVVLVDTLDDVLARALVPPAQPVTPPTPTPLTPPSVGLLDVPTTERVPLSWGNGSSLAGSDQNS